MGQPHLHADACLDARGSAAVGGIVGVYVVPTPYVSGIPLPTSHEPWGGSWHLVTPRTTRLLGAPAPAAADACAPIQYRQYMRSPIQYRQYRRTDPYAVLAVQALTNPIQAPEALSDADSA